MKHRSVHFIGIGGIGMSALAQFFLDQGIKVSGSDRSSSPVTDLLQKKGVQVFIGQKAGNIESLTNIVVYSDAVPPDNPERVRAKELNIPQYSYFGMLGRATEGRRIIAVAGTHGKTTTTAMLAKILKDTGASPTAIIGSIVRDFESNYLRGDPNLFVVEACEYRDHLLELAPEILVITNLEWDHTDWFPSLAALQNTFRKAIEKVPKHGAIIANLNDENIPAILVGAQVRIIDYSKEPAYPLQFPGEFNQMNARAATAAARAFMPRISEDIITGSLAEFRGTWRRFEYKGKTKRGAEVYDDYAHHPTAVAKTLTALRGKVSGEIIAVFHPHLYSRTRDLLEGFAAAFASADEVLIAPIYAAREPDDGSISSETLAAGIRMSGVRARAMSIDEIKSLLERKSVGITIMTMGAGDIYKVADELVQQ